MEFALNFMRSNVGISSPALLSSPFILIALGFYGHKRDYQVAASDSARLRSWVLAANAKGRFSRGSSETILDQDLASLRQGGGIAEMFDRLRLQVGRLDITAEELVGRNRRSALFKTMFLAFHAQGAKDWRSNLVISLDHAGAHHRLQFHHIFPKAFLRKNGFTVREADDIANLSFIAGKTNRQISDKAPIDYLPPFVEKAGPEPFRAQCVPLDVENLGAQAYKEFLRVRRELIAARLNDFLAIEPSDQVSTQS